MNKLIQLNNQQAEIVTNILEPFLNTDLSVQYLKHLYRYRPVKDSTLLDYQIKLREFQLWWFEHYECRIDYFIIPEYKAYLDSVISPKTGQTMKPNSINNKVTVVVGFLKRICKQQRVPKSFFDDFEFSRSKVDSRDRKKVKAFTLQEVNAIEEKIREIEDDYKRTRLLALFYLMAFSGCRISEAISLQGQNINFATKEAKVQTKVGEFRNIMLFSAVGDVVRDFMNHVEDPQGYLFKAQSGPRHRDHISRQAAWQMFKPIVGYFGITDDRVLHAFRHFAGTYFIKETNNDTKLVMEILGHTTTEMTIRYQQLDYTEKIIQRIDGIIGNRVSRFSNEINET